MTLIERTTRSIALTEIGRDFLPQARRLLGELADALVEIRETGMARLAVITGRRFFSTLPFTHFFSHDYRLRIPRST